MHKGLWSALPLGLALLTACGGSGGGGGGASVSGVVALPGALSGSTSAATALPPGTLMGKPWWTQPAASRAVRSGEAIPGQYIVRLRPNLSAQSLKQLSVAGQALRQTAAISALGIGYYHAANALDAAGSTKVLNALQADPRFLSVTPNRRVVAFKTPNDTYFPYQWDAAAMNLPTAWDTATGKAVTVAVVDTGILPGHPDLAGKILPGIDFVDNDTDPTDEGGQTDYHGSHVAGSIAAATNNGRGIAGVSWGAKIVPVRVLGSDGSGSNENIQLGVAWAAGLQITGAPANANPAKVINLSLGGQGQCDSTDQDLYDQVIAKGVTVVVAAGNDNTDASDFTPASCQGVITVGAIGPDGARAPYSNFGSRVDIMAPGGNMDLGLDVNGDTVPGGILSTVKDDKGNYVYAFLQGTSMAAPHVAGAAALLLGENPSLTPAQVLARMKQAAVPLSTGECGHSNGCGAGLLDASAMLAGSGNGTTPTPVPSKRTTIYVAALYEVGSDFDDNLSQLSVLQPQSLLVPYTVSGLTQGSYAVAAWQDLNGNQKIEDNEPFGFYPQDVVVGSSGTRSGIDFDLQPLSVGSQSVTAQDKAKAAFAQLVRRH